MTLNYVDIFVLIILVINIFSAYRKGFILTLFKFTSLIIGIIITKKIYPYISSFIRRSTNVYAQLQQKIMETINIGAVSPETTANSEIDIINNLKVPDILKDRLIENNNYEIHNILNTNNIKEYISAYLANIALNIVVMIVVFIAVMITIKVIVHILDLISKLPILNSINKLFGAAIGAIIGVIVIWLCCIVLTYFYTVPMFQNIITMLESSTIAKFFYENNLLFEMVFIVFKLY